MGKAVQCWMVMETKTGMEVKLDMETEPYAKTGGRIFSKLIDFQRYIVYNKTIVLKQTI